MDKRTIKIKIFLIQVVDSLLVIAVIAIAVLAIVNEENRFYMVLGALVGLVIVHQIGQWTINKISSLRVDLKTLQREERQEELRKKY